MSHSHRSSPEITVYKIQDTFSGLSLLLLSLFVLVFCLGVSSLSQAQLVPDSYGNNATDVRWQHVETDHFKIVFAERQSDIISYIASEAEAIFREYKNRIGVAPDQKISLFYNGPGELVSGIRGQDTDDEYSIWRGNIFTKSLVPGLQGIDELLRLEIAYVFRQHVESFPIDYWFYLFARPSQSPWSDGITSYLAQPQQTPHDVSMMRNYWYDRSYNITEPSLQHRINTITGRSQIQYFNEFFKDDSLQEMYTHRSWLLGIIPNYDFKSAFKTSYGLSYERFKTRWESYGFGQYQKQQPGPNSSAARILPPAHVLEYHGLAVNSKRGLMAILSTPDNGNILSQLQVKPIRPGAKQTLVKKGFFHPVLDWSPNGELLAYARRSYKNRSGQYAFQLYIWDSKTDKAEVIVPDKNALLPAFSPDGSALVFAERTASATVIWRYNMQTNEHQKIHSFPQPTSVSHIDYHPKKDSILVSYKQNKLFKAGLLNANSSAITPLLTQHDVVLNAQWGPDGDAIYFNREAEKVPNIFRAIIAGNEVENIRQVTSDFYGAELMGFLQQGSDSLGLLAKTDRDKINVLLVDPPSSETSVSAMENAGNSSTGSPAANQTSLGDYSVKSYNAFTDVSWEKRFAIPYYLSRDEFGLAAYLSAIDPMKTHEFDYRGTIALADPSQSFFYSSYTNNSFRPRLELTYNHFPSASGFFGKSREVRTSDIIGLSSLWKLTGLSQGYSDWYFGLTLRHLAFDYFSAGTFRRHHPDLYFNNQRNRQTDLKATLVWRELEPSRHIHIHPLDGTGVRFSATGSAEILGSQTQNIRLNVDAYHIFPAFGNHRLYAYANGVMDVGQPTGRDYISFADNGNFQLPDEDFLGSMNPGIDRFVRGYNTTVLGDDLLFGKLEYRIPFQFDTSKKLFRFIPPARTVFAFFADGGVMGNARTSLNTRRTESRYSLGAEIKRVFSFAGGFEITYKVGLGQPLTQSFDPQPYVNIRSALPF